MARFNLDDYETVESRIKRFYEAHPDGRIITEWANRSDWIDAAEKKAPNNWVMKATIYLSAGDQANNLPKATGYAQETDGTGGANNVDAMANAETSCIGRCLANLAMSGNKRASREEMQKVVAMTDFQVNLDIDYLSKLDELTTKEEVRQLYADALRAKVGKDSLDKITEKGKSLK